MIAKVNKDFVGVYLNLTDQTFPKEAPGLAPWKIHFDQSIFKVGGFVTSVVLTPDGQMPLGTTGMITDFGQGSMVNFMPDAYLKFLDESLEWFAKARAQRQAAER